MLLWGSAAIFTRWGLDNASPMALLVFRFLVALVALAPLAIVRRRWLPAPGTRLQTAATGLMLIGGYSVCYFEAMANGVTPGLIATIMGSSPSLRFAWWSAACRGGGCQDCCLTLAGLVLLVWRSSGGLADGDGGDPVCAGGAVADDLGAPWQSAAVGRRRMSCRCGMPLVWGCAR